MVKKYIKSPTFYFFAFTLPPIVLEKLFYSCLLRLGDLRHFQLSVFCSPSRLTKESFSKRNTLRLPELNYSSECYGCSFTLAFPPCDLLKSQNFSSKLPRKAQLLTQLNRNRIPMMPYTYDCMLQHILLDENHKSEILNHVIALPTVPKLQFANNNGSCYQIVDT